MGFLSALSSATKFQRQVQFIVQGTGTVISLDCSVKETHSRTSTPTKFAVEDGSTISDHIVVDPFELEIEGVISDTPISTVNSVLTTVAGLALPKVGIIAGAAALAVGSAIFSALNNSASPSVANYAKLIEYQQSRKVFDIITTLNRYTNMVISGLSVPRDAGNSNELAFTIKLTELRLVQPKSVNIQIFSDADISADEAKLGKQETDNAILAAAKKGVAKAEGLVK